MKKNSGKVPNQQICEPVFASLIRVPSPLHPAAGVFVANQYCRSPPPVGGAVHLAALPSSPFVFVQLQSRRSVKVSRPCRFSSPPVLSPPPPPPPGRCTDA